MKSALRLLTAAVLTLALAGLTGCASQQKWCHKVATAEEAEKYSEQCLQDATVKVRERTRAEEPITVYREHEKCMRGFGFFPCR